MKLTISEMTIISRAERSIKRANISRTLMLAVMLIGFSGMLLGAVSPDLFAFFSFAVVLYAMLLPQLGGPPYDEIVALLVKLRSETYEQERSNADSLVDVLTRKP
jgi:hypothetical protein